MNIVINSTIDSLTLARIKQHLQVDEDFIDDNSLISAYSMASLTYVENYTGKSWAIWSISETFPEFVNPMCLDWAQNVRTANIVYPTSAGTNNIDVTVYTNNTIREIAPDDYVGGEITVTFSPYVDAHQKYIAEQCRLLMIGDCYSHREDTITGTIVSKLPNGVINILGTIQEGRI